MTEHQWKLFCFLFQNRFVSFSSKVISCIDQFMNKVSSRLTDLKMIKKTHCQCLGVYWLSMSVWALFHWSNMCQSLIEHVPGSYSTSVTVLAKQSPTVQFHFRIEFKLIKLYFPNRYHCLFSLQLLQRPINFIAGVGYIWQRPIILTVVLECLQVLNINLFLHKGWLQLKVFWRQVILNASL